VVGVTVVGVTVVVGWAPEVDGEVAAVGDLGGGDPLQAASSRTEAAR
jgi:hypothetical protein